MSRYPRPVRNARLKCISCNAPVVETVDETYYCVDCGSSPIQPDDGDSAGGADGSSAVDNSDVGDSSGVGDTSVGDTTDGTDAADTAKWQAASDSASD